MQTSLQIRALLTLVIPILIAALISAARMGLADQLLRAPEGESLRRAKELDPLNPRSAVAEAQAADQEGSSNATQAWRHAAELDPQNARILIAAGISAELSGNKSLAQDYYSRAERFSHTWVPRWTLANFHFRQGENDETLKWLKKALERSYGDLTAAFDLCEQAGAKEEQILTQIVPKESHPLVQYLEYLGKRPPITPEAARVMQLTAKELERTAATSEDPESSKALVSSVTRLIEAGLPTEAKAIWYSACESRVAKCSSPPDDGLITNGRLLVPFLQNGFDWHLLQPPGTTAVHQPGSGTVKITLMGTQPEQSDFLSQPLHLQAGKSWRVKLEYQTREITPRTSGFEWLLDKEPLPMERPLASDDWAEGSFEIPAAPFERLSQLRLVYVRKPGTTRSEGELWIRNIHAEPNR